jgi:hypothetical protein
MGPRPTLRSTVKIFLHLLSECVRKLNVSNTESGDQKASFFADFSAPLWRCFLTPGIGRCNRDWSVLPREALCGEPQKNRVALNLDNPIESRGISKLNSGHWKRAPVLLKR